MWLSAINGRPERRSDDGQMILRAARVAQKLRLDLLVCGAPLRNRTVDLLLTIWRQGGQWRSMSQASRLIRVSCSQVGAVSLLHFAAAQLYPAPPDRRASVVCPSMRTTGRVVIHGRSRKCLARIGLPEVVLRRGRLLLFGAARERHPRPGGHRQTGHWPRGSNSVRGSSAHPCRAVADYRRGVAKLPRMRRILLGGVVGVLLLAVGTRAADALGIGGSRLRCGCVETCWCKRPGLTVFRWVTPGGWHHIGLTAEEKQSRHSQS
jgi:hypothetical protein